MIFINDKKDHVFIAQSEMQKWLAFCQVEAGDKEEARCKIRAVFDDKKQTILWQLNYIGIINFTKMDANTTAQLHLFEKYDPVWLLSITSNEKSKVNKGALQMPKKKRRNF